MASPKDREDREDSEADSETTAHHPAIPEPRAHGGDAAAIAAAMGVDVDSILDLSASLNPFAPDVVALSSKYLGSLVAYPDDTEATLALAAAIGVDPQRLVLTNGGAEAIALLASALGEGAIVEPEFSLYRRHLPVVDDAAGRWRSNPSNPLGQLAMPNETAAVWDEAFYPIATGAWTRGDDDSWRLGSLTKLWACAGLRLGFVIAPDREGAAEIRGRGPRWSVNGLALAMVPEMLELTQLTDWCGRLADLRGTFAGDLRGLGLQVDESVANWVLVHDVASLRAALVPNGIVVRDCSNFGLPGTIRVAVPKLKQLPMVVQTIASCLT